MSKREVLEAVPVLPLDSEHCFPFPKVIHSTLERLCPNPFLVVVTEGRVAISLFSILSRSCFSP
jgi:hypothetical protein